MKTNIHPIWYKETKVTCACGNTFVTGSVLPAITVEICAKCHPFFTGQQKFIDTLGQVEKFQNKTTKAQEKSIIKKQILQARAEKIKETKSDKPSLKDLLVQARKNLNS